MANLLINTTVGGNAVITTSNIGSYALTSIPATISPTNVNIGNAIYFGAGNNYLNWDGARINSNVGIQSTSNMRAPIFYDSADTAYYLDPNSTSYLYHLILSGNSYFRPQSWIQFDGNYGIYWPNNYGLHIYPNGGGSYGALQINGVKNGWAGIYFNDSGNTIMANSNESGFHRQGSGWQFRWTEGTMYVHRSTNGGGTAYTVVDSGNVGNYTSGNSNQLGGYSLDTMKKYIWSRGENLLTNGTGLMGNNTNFGSFTFDGSQAYFSSGSFRYTGQYGAPNTDELMPMNPEKRYRLDFWAKTLNGQGAYYAYLNFFDVDGQAIVAPHHMYYANTLTTLAQTLNPGDTVVYLNSVANWENGGTAGVSTHIRSFIFWNYTNSFGYTYPPQTYSRNWYPDSWNPGAINSGNNTITLRVPWSGPTIAAGTQVSNGSAGGTYKYIALGYTIVPTTWTNYVGIMDGVDYSGSNAGGKFPPGTASAKLGFLTDYNASGDTIYLANLFVGVDNDYPIYDRWTGNTRIEKSGAFYGTMFYDSNNGSYYLDPSSTSRLGTLNINQLSVYGNTYLGDGNGDEVHINDVLRVGATDSGDAHFFFGEGGSAGSDYGSHWYWDSGYTFTWNTRNNGTDTALFSYLTNDTSYVNWSRNFNMQNREVNYVSQLHFNGGTRFVNYNSNYLYFQPDSTSVGGILVRDGNSSTRGYSAYFDGSGFGLLNSTGNWGIRLNPGNVGTELYYAGGIKLATLSEGTRIYGNLHLDDNYGYGIVGVYSSSRYQGVWAMGNSYKLSADGTSTGNLYGLAWSHPDAGGQTKAGLEHQLLVMNYGVTQTAIGTGIWTTGLITTTSYGTSANWNTAYGWGNHASAGYQAASTAITTSNIGSQSVSNSNYINSTRDTPSGALQYWNAPSLGLDEAPSSDWHNTIRMGHGSPLSYYSNTLAVRMTGSGVGDIYTQTIMGGTRQGWKKHWNDGNDGSGSGLDADLLDGQEGSYYQPASTAITTSNIGSQSVSYATTSGNAATTSQRDFSGDISTSGMGRFAGWYTGNAQTGLAAEIGTSGGQVYIIAYNRQTAAYGTLNIEASAATLRISGSTVNVVTGALQQGGNQVLHAGNYTSYSPSLTGSGASGTWSINVTGSAGSATTAINLIGLGSIQSTSTGTSYTANYQVRENSGGGGNTNEIYAPQLAFHWSGVVASSIMMESSGRMAIRNNPGGSYENFIAAVIYSSGYGDSTQWNTAYSWGNHASAGYLTGAHNHDDRYYTETESDARYPYYRGYSTSGNTQTFQSTANTLRFDQVGALDNGSWSNQPTGYYTYGGILSLRGESFALQIYGSHTGDLAFKTQWNNDQYSGWRTIISSANIGSQSVSYASTAGSANSVSWSNVSGRPTNVSSFTNDSGYLTGITSGQVTGALGYTPYNSSNPSGYITSSGSISGNAATATLASTVTINYNNDSNSSYQLLWGSGNSVYGTANIYVNPSSDTIYATAYRGNANVAGTGEAIYAPAGVYSTGTNWLYGTMYVNGNSINDASYFGIIGTNTTPINITGASHKYITINPGNGYEAMVRYIGGSGSSWYVGKRTSSQLVGTESFHFYSEQAGATVGGIDTSGNIHASGSMRAPIFYDSQNTDYYGDFASESRFNTFTTAGSVVIGGTFANNAYNAVASTRLMFGGGNEPNGYSIGTNMENYGGNYTKLDLRWHTGIRMGAQPGYGGIRFYNTEALGTRIMSIGEGDANIRIDNNLWIGGAGGWITDLLNAKQNASTAINTGNIGSQSVSYASSAGSVAWTNVSSRPTALSQFSNDLGNYGGWITSSGSISGNAATATNVAWTGVTGRPTALSQFSNDLGNYGGWLTTGGKAADSELFDGTDSIYFVKGNGTNALGRTTTNNSGANSAGGLSSGFYDGSGMSNMPTSDWYHLIVNAHHNSATTNQYEFHIATPFWDKSNFYVRSISPGDVGPWRTLIHNGNIGSQSVSYASTAGSASTATTATTATVASQLNKFGDIYGQDWNGYYVQDKLIAAAVYGHSGANRPNLTYDYGVALSYGEATGPRMQMYFPENSPNLGTIFRKATYRTGWNGNWSNWKTLVEQEGNTCTIVGGNGTGLEVHGNVGYNQDPLTYFLLRGQADTSWKALKVRLTGDAGGQDIEFRRIAENGADSRMWYVPRGGNTVNFEYPIVQPSDSRLKDNITPITTPVEKIKALSGVEFDWNSGEQVGTHDVGLIAQDVEAVLPEAVTTQEDGYKNLAYTKVIPLLVEAMKEQQAMIEALKAEIELLKNK